MAFQKRKKERTPSFFCVLPLKLKRKASSKIKVHPAPGWYPVPEVVSGTAPARVPCPTPEESTTTPPPQEQSLSPAPGTAPPPRSWWWSREPPRVVEPQPGWSRRRQSRRRCDRSSSRTPRRLLPPRSPPAKPEVGWLPACAGPTARGGVQLPRGGLSPPLLRRGGPTLLAGFSSPAQEPEMNFFSPPPWRLFPF